MSEQLEFIERATRPHPDFSVIWLHGLGADGHDFEPIVPYLDLAGVAVRFIFPHAPVRPVTLNGGMAMRAWFDLLDLDRLGRQDERGIRESAGQVAALLQREQARGIGGDRIVLAGFSQGGAIALHLGLRWPGPLAGIMALSSYLPLAESLDDEVAASANKVPVFMAHGRQDPVLPLAWGQAARDRLLARGCAVQWREYDMPHAVCDEEISDIGAWLRSLISRA